MSCLHDGALPMYRETFSWRLLSRLARRLMQVRQGRRMYKSTLLRMLLVRPQFLSYIYVGQASCCTYLPEAGNCGRCSGSSPWICTETDILGLVVDRVVEAAVTGH